MAFVIRATHLLALGLWLGGVAFFSFFTALPVINAMQELAQHPDNWLHLQTKDEGTRLAGEFLTVTFARYFPFQVAVGVVALVTALLWPNVPSRVHKVRVALVAFAFLLALTNMLFLAPRVGELRMARYGSDAVQARLANEAFAAWHNYSLGADMLGLALVAVALALVGYRPYYAALAAER